MPHTMKDSIANAWPPAQEKPASSSIFFGLIIGVPLSLALWIAIVATICFAIV